MAKDLEVDLVAPMLTYLECSYGAVQSSCPPVCPSLMVLQLGAVPSGVERLLGITTLTRLSLGELDLMVTPFNCVRTCILASQQEALF